MQQVASLSHPDFIIVAILHPRPRGHSSVLSDLQSFPAAARWQARADSFYGNGQQATDAALAHRLPSGSLTQNPGTIGTTVK